jgi:hypothetical protein
MAALELLWFKEIPDSVDARLRKLLMLAISDLH